MKMAALQLQVCRLQSPGSKSRRSLQSCSRRPHTTRAAQRGRVVVSCAQADTDIQSSIRVPSQYLNNTFGLELSIKDSAELGRDEVVQQIKDAFTQSGGLVVIKGANDLLPRQLVQFTSQFGAVEQNPGIKREYLVPGYEEIQVIGNVKDHQGNPRAIFADAAVIQDSDIQYDPSRCEPVWHTDQLFRDPQPAGSMLYCREAPPTGGDTCFADMAAAYEALPSEEQARLLSLRAVCSYAHHNAKIQKKTPTYPLLSEEDRRKFPPLYRPIVACHPFSGRLCLSGFNSSVCAVLEAGETLTQEQVDVMEIQGEEDPSVAEQLYAKLLPFATSPQFTIQHSWEEGDLVIWDNRCTIHAATGFESQKFPREMWRTTFAPYFEAS
mmetsp:Transcript_40720/g.49396  ORF Transcript_40720/g.49396 Transcript_40720/m.49396 type:complete len:381 (+) Transcript_40720:114-1256(+)